MKGLIELIGEFYSYDVPVSIAILLGVVYIVSFLGAVYFGIDLCQKFRESIIGKYVKIIFAVTFFAFIFYPALLKFYPQEIMSINATLGILEIVSLLYLMFWQGIYISFVFYIKGAIFIIRVLFYSIIILVILQLVNIDIINIDYVITLAIFYRLFEIRDDIYNNSTRIYRNLLYNFKCIFTLY